MQHHIPPVHDGPVGPPVNVAYFTNIDVSGRCLKLWAQFNQQEVQEVESMLKIARQQIDSLPPVLPNQLHIGGKYLGKFSADGNFYRALVNEIRYDLQAVHVTFMDFGNKDWIALSDLKMADDRLNRFRPQASECYVENVLCCGDGWSEIAVKALNEQICYENLPYSCGGNCAGLMAIDLFVDTKYNRCSDWLVANKMGVRADPSVVASEILRKSQSNDVCGITANGIQLSRRPSNTPTPPPPPGLVAQPAVTMTTGIHGLPSVPSSGIYPSMQGSMYGIRPQQPQPQFTLSHLQQQQRQQQSAPAVPVSHQQHYSLPAMQYAVTSANYAPSPPQPPGVGMPTIYQQQQQQTPMQLSSSRVPDSFSDVYAQQQQQQHPVAPRIMPPSYAPVPQHTLPPVLRQYKRRTLQKRNRYDLIICFIKDPEEFYVRLAETEQELMDLMMKMNEFYQNSPQALRSLPSYEVGAPCVVRHKNDDDYDLLYRGLIKQVNQNAIVVRFVDYGNDQTFARNDVKYIDDQFLRPELYAIQSCFDGMPSRGFWSDEEIRVFQSLVLNKQFKGSLTDVDEICAWQIFDSVTKRPVVEILLENLDGTKVEKVDRGRKLNASTVIARPIPRKPAQMAFRQFTRLPASKFMGKDYTVAVVYVTNPSLFWVQLKERADEFYQMSQNLNEFCNAPTSNDLLDISDLSVGTACAACFSDDATWYRAEVLKADAATNYVEVTFVDYGNSDRVALLYVKPLKPEFGALPVQGIKSRLHNLAPIDDDSDWSAQAISVMNHFVGKQNQAHFEKLDDDGAWQLDLLCSENDAPFKNIASYFVENKYAKRLSVSPAVGRIAADNIRHTSIGEIDGTAIPVTPLGLDSILLGD